jgi:hypothetical protein
MIHRLASSTAALLLVCGGFAVADTQNTELPESELQKELGTKLDQFVSDAIEGGLLEPSLNVPDPEPAPRRAPKQITHKPIKTEPIAAPIDIPESVPVEAIVVETPPAQKIAPPKCDEIYALDFSKYESLRRYADLDAYKSFEEDDVAARNKLIKAMISLGLYREARVKSKELDNPASQSLHQLAILFENNGVYEGDYFSRLAGCYRGAKLWDAIRSVADGRPGSANALSRHLTEYRYLPYHLKIDVAAMVIPALVDQEQHMLAEKLMASFSAEEIQQSPRLEFVEAIIDMEAGKAAQPAVEKYLLHSDFQLAAMSTLLKQGEITSPAQREMIHGQIVQSLRNAKTDREVAVRLRFALTELGTASNYPVMMQIAELPRFQQPHIQEEILRHLSQSAKRDMQGSDDLRKMATIDLLIDGPSTLIDTRGGDALYEDAATYAESIGRMKIAAFLRGRTQGASHDVAKPKTILSADHEQTTVVPNVRHADGLSILEEAMAALNDNDIARYRELEPRLPTDADTLTQLLEAEARSGNWLVTPRTYRLADAVTEASYAKRIARAQRIKAITQRAERANTAFSITEVDAVLSHSKDAMGTLESKVN